MKKKKFRIDSSSVFIASVFFFNECALNSKKAFNPKFKKIAKNSENFNECGFNPKFKKMQKNSKNSENVGFLLNFTLYSVLLCPFRITPLLNFTPYSVYNNSFILLLTLFLNFELIAALF
jgi:hypothetical protein